MERAVFEYIAQSGNIGALLVALAIAGARPLGFVLLCPIFSRFGVQEGIVRGGVLLALTLPSLPIVVGEFASSGMPQTAAMAGIIGKELLVGVVLGLLAGLPFWAAAAAGDITDLSRGAAMASLVDPGSGSETSVTGTFFFLVCVLWLIGLGAFVPALFGPLFETYALYPIFSALPPIEAARGAEVLAFLARLTAAGLILALPLVLPFLLLDVILGVATKNLKQMNPMFLSMSVKQGVFVLILLIYTGFLAAYAFRDFGAYDQMTDVVQTFFGAAR